MRTTQSESTTTASPAPKLDFKKGRGLVPAIAQDDQTGEVLMLAYMNKEAWEKTLATGQAYYYSRSRRKLWMKGEESGNVQRIRSIAVDCDNDTILLRIEQVGGVTCHTGTCSCFTNRTVSTKGGTSD